MKVFMLWHGGSGYAPPDQFVREHIEEFDTVGEAIEAFRSRADFDPYYPCVEALPAEEGGASAWLCFDDPYENGDLYPDRILEFGPRGGVRMVAA